MRYAYLILIFLNIQPEHKEKNSIRYEVKMKNASVQQSGFMPYVYQKRVKYSHSHISKQMIPHFFSIEISTCMTNV